MKVLLTLLVGLMSLVNVALAQPANGAEDAPFGLTWGMSAVEVTKLGVKLTETSGKEFGTAYAATALPKMIADVEGVLLCFGYDDKLWRMAAFSKTFSADSYGMAVMKRYDELAALLSEKYGAPKKVHNLSDRLWKKSSEFVMALKQGEANWFSDFNTPQLFIQLSIAGESSDAAFWRLIAAHKGLRDNFGKAKKAYEKGAL